ncbi:ATP-binding protein [Megalodesulfovibrio paquesii]
MPDIVMEHLRLPATMDNLARARDFVLSRAPAILEHKVDLVLEELFLNVANYAYGTSETGGTGEAGAPGEIEISCGVDERVSPPRFHLCVADWGHAFDPLALPGPDLAADLDEREPGGLGVHLVRQMTNSLEYSREADTNLLHCCFFFSS